MDTYVNKKLSQASQQQRNDTLSGVSKMYSNPVDEYNLNSAFLLMIAQNIDNWRLIKTYGINGNKSCPDYYLQLITIIECMLDFLSAKIKPEEEVEYVRQIELLLNESMTMFKTNPLGQLMYDQQGARLLQNKLSMLFRNLMRRLDDTGMLTKKSLDPRLAMSDIE